MVWRCKWKAVHHLIRSKMWSFVEQNLNRDVRVVVRVGERGWRRRLRQARRTFCAERSEAHYN